VIYAQAMTPPRRWSVRWLAVLPVLVVVLTACAGGLRGRPVGPLVEEFMASVVDGDLDRAWILATGGRDEPVRATRVGRGVALDRGHFDAAFGSVVSAERADVMGWDLTRRDGIAFWVLVDQMAEDRVSVRPTTWMVTLVDDAGQPTGVLIDGHPAPVEWRSWAHGLQWNATFVTYQGPRLLEVSLARGGTMDVMLVREGPPGRQTCCVTLNGISGQISIERQGEAPSNG
jgi:hypothetical protein